MTDKPNPRLRRTGERLMRLAYDMEILASRLRHEQEPSAGYGVLDIARKLGNIGRDLDRRHNP